MADDSIPAENGTAPATEAQNGQLPANMQVLAQFIRDFSFENPRAPNSLRMDQRPEIDMGVEMNAKGRPDGLFEVDLKLSVKASNPEGPMFAIELVYGGLFQLANVPQAAIEPTLLVECPRYLFPFAPRIIADATSDGGFFPPFLVEPIDFAALYMQQKGQIGETAGQA